MPDQLYSRLPLMQNAEIENKVVLLRVDHNVVKGGKIHDPYRIDQTIGTIFNIVERGGRLIIMTHVGRPRDKKSGDIKIDDKTSVKPIVEYLENKLHTKIYLAEFNPDSGKGIRGIDTSINLAIKKLKEKQISAIYLPNTRWFIGEESEGSDRDAFSLQMAGLADVFINDAFGSWQPHASTFDITKHLPSYAGYLMQHEILNLSTVLEPKKPFLAVIAGAKFDTKIGPLYEIYNKVDNLILGGVIYNTYLCAKYDVKIKGIAQTDIDSAQKLVELDEQKKKILELPYLYESDTLEGKIDGKFRKVNISDFKSGLELNYIVDIAQESFDTAPISTAVNNSKTIFVNAVMGYTPHFTEGSAALDNKIDQNQSARKLYGGGDTLLEFKALCPGLYLSVLDNSKYYFFTGGGSVLKAIEAGSPFGLMPVKALLDNGGK